QGVVLQPGGGDVLRRFRRDHVADLDQRRQVRVFVGGDFGRGAGVHWGACLATSACCLTDPRMTVPAGPSSGNECGWNARTTSARSGTTNDSRSRLLMFPVEISNSFAGRPRRRCESTKSASLVTTTRCSRSARSLICSSVVRFPSGKSSVCRALHP